MFSWIPILGPIIDGIVSIVVKLSDTSVAKAKIEGAVTVEALKASVETIKITEDDIGVRLARDVVLWPWAAWIGFIGWDKIVAYHWPFLVMNVSPLPVNLSYMPLAVMSFLLGYAAIFRWIR
jgi:hypothetical protein